MPYTKDGEKHFSTVSKYMHIMHTLVLFSFRRYFQQIIHSRYVYYSPFTRERGETRGETKSAILFLKIGTRSITLEVAVVQNRLIWEEHPDKFLKVGLVAEGIKFNNNYYFGSSVFHVSYLIFFVKASERIK